MSIIAYIAKRNKGTTLRGDIFQVGMVGAPIGRLTRRAFGFMVIDDPALEARLEARKIQLERQFGRTIWPTIGYPYATRRAGENGLAKTSTRAIAFADLDPATVAEIDDNTRDSPIIPIRTITVRTR